MSSDLVIETRNLEKAYGAKVVLNGLDLRLEAGQVLGFLGRNGSGKTTTLRILVGLRRATGGLARVFGHDCWRLPMRERHRIGYLSESQTTFPWMRVEQLLEFAAAFHPRWDRSYAQDLLRKLELPTRERIRTLSLGQERRLGLLLALCHHPDLLILDEPAGGLDPVVRREFLDVVIDLVAREGKSVIFSSHILTDVERLASHIGILEGGRLLYQGSLDSLQDSVREVDLELDGASESIEVPDAVRIVRRGPRSWTVTMPKWDEMALGHLQARFPAARLSARALSLEEIFLAYVGGRRE
jgi:ABC-2 type transport system ATP-binding protein